MASTKLVSAGAEKQQVYLVAQKKLQIMDTCIKIQRAWQARSDRKGAVDEFMQQMNLLIVFPRPSRRSTSLASTCGICACRSWSLRWEQEIILDSCHLVEKIIEKVFLQKIK